MTDASGGTLGLHRPGWRGEDGGNVGDQLVRNGHRRDLAELYTRHNDELANEWRSGNPPTGFGSKEFIGQREGDLCTIDGWPGHLRPGQDGELHASLTVSGATPRPQTPTTSTTPP